LTYFRRLSKNLYLGFFDRLTIYRQLTSQSELQIQTDTKFGLTYYILLKSVKNLPF